MQSCCKLAILPLVCLYLKSTTERNQPSGPKMGGRGLEVVELEGVHCIPVAVEIVNGQVSSKPPEGDEKWSPWTPSPYQINLSETHSTLTPYSGGSDHAELTALAHTPLRPARDCHTLSAIMAAAGQSLDGTHVSIIAAVRHVSWP